MRETTSSFFLILLIITLTASWWQVSALSPPSGGIAGQYTTSVVNRDGSTYRGKVEILELGNLLYWLEWHDGKTSYTGKGALVGDTLYIVWGSAAAQCSAVFFELDAEGTLDGIWFRAQGRNAEMSEITAEPTTLEGQNGIEGHYLVSAQRLGTSSFPSALEISSLGEGHFLFHWEGEVTQSGIGLMVDDQIQVIASPASGRGQCGKSQMHLTTDGRLTGTWTMNDEHFRLRGRETMVPLP